MFESQHEAAPPVLFKQLHLDTTEQVLSVVRANLGNGVTRVIFLTNRQIISFHLKADPTRGTLYLVEPRVNRTQGIDSIDLI